MGIKNKNMLFIDFQNNLHIKFGLMKEQRQLCK
jgi:hypothetical protein